MRSADICGLYAVADTDVIGPGSLPDAVAAALRGGARVIQYRDKGGGWQRRLDQAGSLMALCQRAGAPLIVNDDVALAAAVPADGVHLGKADASVAAARRSLGPRALIGVSCYNELARARDAVAAGADYVAFGRVYPSQTKPGEVYASLELLSAAAQQLPCPVVAIGGITAANAAPVIRAGARAVAVIGAVFAAPDIRQAARDIADLFGSPPAPSAAPRCAEE